MTTPTLKVSDALYAFKQLVEDLENMNQDLELENTECRFPIEVSITEYMSKIEKCRKAGIDMYRMKDQKKSKVLVLGKGMVTIYLNPPSCLPRFGALRCGPGGTGR